MSLIAPKAEQQRRSELCRACPEFSPITPARRLGWCVRCNCLVPLKTIPAGEKCPVGKW